MSRGYTFEGKHYVTIAEWQREWPIFASFVDDLRSGADTAMEMEKRRAERLRVARIKSRESARRQNKPRGMTR